MANDLNTFANKLQQVPKSMSEGLHSIVLQAMWDILRVLARATVDKHMKQGTKDSPTHATMVTHRSGALRRELLKSDDPMTRNVTVTGTKYTGIFGASLARVWYAKLLEKGGFVKAKQVTVIREFMPSDRKHPKKFNLKYAQETMGAARKPFQTYQMARFLWAKFYESKDEKWKRMAMSVHKKGGVDIRAHPYLAPTLADQEVMNRCRELVAGRLAKGLAEKIRIGQSINLGGQVVG